MSDVLFFTVYLDSSTIDRFKFVDYTRKRRRVEIRNGIIKVSLKKPRARVDTRARQMQRKMAPLLLHDHVCMQVMYMEN